MDPDTNPKAKRAARHRRRGFLGLIGTAGILGLAGCLGDDDDEPEDDTEVGDDSDDTDDADDSDDDPSDDATFAVSDLEPAEVTIEVGGTFDLSATITNIGDGDGTQDIEVRVDDDVIASESHSVDRFDSVSITFEDLDPGELGEGDYTHGVYSDDDNSTGTLTIEPLPDLNDPLLSFDDDFLTQGSNELHGTLSNGNSVDIQDGVVELSVPDGWEITDETGTTFDELAQFASQAVEWAIEVPDGADGDYELEADVSYQTDRQEAAFTVTHTVTVFDEDGAQYFWSAEDETVGENPDDHWEAFEHTDLWEIMDDDDGQYMGINGPGSERSFVRFSDVPPAREVEIYATLKATDDESGDYWAYVRSPNEDDADNVEQARADDQLGSGNHRLAEYQNGDFNSLESRTHVAGPGVQYEMRARYWGDTWQARWWLTDEDEPDEWDLETETGAEDPGFTGVAHWTGEDFRIYEFGVGTGGEEAPTE